MPIINQRLANNPVPQNVQLGHDYLHQLINCGDLASLQHHIPHYLKAFGKAYFYSPYTNFIIHALNEDKEDIAEFLLQTFIEKKMDEVIWTVIDDETVLSVAARKNAERIVKILTTAYPDPKIEPVLYFQGNISNTTAYEIDSPLKRAIANKNPVITQLLLQKMLPEVLLRELLNKKNGQTLLHYPNINPEIYAHLLTAISSLSFTDRRRIFSTPDQNGNSPLHVACKAGDFHKARELISLGASLLDVNSENQSPICYLSDENALKLMTHANRLGTFIGGNPTHPVLQKATIPILNLMPTHNINKNIISDPASGTVFYTNTVRVSQVIQALEILIQWLTQKSSTEDRDWLPQILNQYVLSEEQLFLHLQFIYQLFKEKQLLNQQIDDGIYAMLTSFGKQTTKPTSAEVLITRKSISEQQQPIIEAFFIEIYNQIIQEILPTSINLSEDFNKIIKNLRKEREFAEHCCASIKQSAEVRLLEGYKLNDPKKNILLFLKCLAPSLKTIIINHWNDPEFLDNFDRKFLEKTYEQLPEELQALLPGLLAFIEGRSISLQVISPIDELTTNRTDLFNFKQEINRFRNYLNAYDQMTWQGIFSNRIDEYSAERYSLLVVFAMLSMIGGIFLLSRFRGHHRDESGTSKYIPPNIAGIIGGAVLLSLSIFVFFDACLSDYLKFSPMAFIQKLIRNSGYWNHNKLEETQAALSLDERALLDSIIENASRLQNSLSDDDQQLAESIRTVLTFMTDTTTTLRILLAQTDQLIEDINTLETQLNIQERPIAWQHTVFQPPRQLTEIVIEPPTERTPLLVSINH